MASIESSLYFNAVHSAQKALKVFFIRDLKVMGENVLGTVSQEPSDIHPQVSTLGYSVQFKYVSNGKALCDVNLAEQQSLELLT